MEILLKAIYCMAYFGMMRVSELGLSDHTAKAANIHIVNKDKILVALYTSKTHGEESDPQKIKITADNRMQEQGK